LLQIGSCAHSRLTEITHIRLREEREEGRENGGEMRGKRRKGGSNIERCRVKRDKRGEKMEERVGGERV
jgi:hypothetical protein